MSARVAAEITLGLMVKLFKLVPLLLLLGIVYWMFFGVWAWPFTRGIERYDGPADYPRALAAMSAAYGADASFLPATLHDDATEIWIRGSDDGTLQAEPYLFVGMLVPPQTAAKEVERLSGFGESVPFTGNFPAFSSSYFDTIAEYPAMVDFELKAGPRTFARALVDPVQGIIIYDISGD